MPSFRRQFSTGNFDEATHEPILLPRESSLIVAILSAGCIFGSLVSAPVGDFFGRRKSLIIAIGAFCFGVLFQVLSANIPMLLVGR